MIPLFKKGVKMKKIYLFGIVILSVFLLLNNLKKYEEIYVEPIVIENKPTYKEEIEVLRKENNNDDIIGTIEILNSNFKAPILQSVDNNYYLRRLPNKESNINGSIFMDYRTNINTSKKILIYGHNDSYLKMPFDILEEYYNKDFFDNHRYLEIKSYENKLRRYEVFSVFVEYKDFSYMKVNYKDNEYIEHLNSLKNKSMHKTDVELSGDDNILILQACSTHPDYAKYSKKYVLVVFKEIKDL